MAWLARQRPKFIRLLQRFGFSRDWFLIPIAAGIGILAAFIALGFAFMVHTCDDLFFRTVGGESLDSYEGYKIFLLILLPALGGLAVGLIQRYISRSAPGHGIPEVIESLARNGGIIRGRVGIFKAVTASLTIGSGGSAGMEGPIVQIGAVLGSVVGQVFRVGREHMTTLVGCGAAAGLASLFNTPIAGVLFVLEVMLRDYSTRNIMPLVIASVFGVATTQAMKGGNEAIFPVSNSLHNYGFTLDQVGWYMILGVLCGLTGVAFIRLLYASERFWTKVKIPRALKPAAGGMGLGLMGVAFVLVFNQPIANYQPPVFFSNGYPVISSALMPASYENHKTANNEVVGNEVAGHTDAPPPPTAVEKIQEELLPQNDQPGHSPIAHAPADHHLDESTPTASNMTIYLLLAALGLKLVGTCLTLGSGGSGGVFAPSLFMGAMLGGAFGLILQKFGLVAEGTPATFALAGMAGVLAGAVHCPLTAFLLVFEITRDYKVILPVMLVSILATLIAQVRLRDSIYTLALHERGIRMGTHADLTLLRRLEVSAIPLTPAVLVHPQDPAQRLIDLAEDYSVTDYVVCDDEDLYIGMVVGEDVRTTLLQREAVPLMIVSELMRTDLATVARTETLEIVLDKFARHEVSSLTMIDDNRKVLGMITRSRLMRHYQQELEQQG